MKKLILALVLLACSAAQALADNCAAYPYTLTNGTTADASQVMANLNSVLACGNNLLLGRNNNLSDVQSPSTALGNLGGKNGATTTITVSTGTPSGTGNAGDLWIQW